TREGRSTGGDKQQRESWTKVEPKKTRVRQSRPDAIVIQGATGVSYVDILRSVKTEPKLKDLAQLVKGIRKTAKGELLFELVRASDTNTKVMQEAVSTLLGDKAEVRILSETVSLEVKDIEELTTETEILEALVTQFGGTDISRSSIQSLRPAYGGTQTATLRVSGGLAGKLLSAGKIRIGWVICRIRQKVQPIRCFRCMEFAAQDLLEQTLRERKIDVAILCEPYRHKSLNTWVGDRNGKAAVWSCGRNPAMVSEAISGSFFYTFSRGSMGSTIDVTFVSGSLSRRASWKVCSDYTHSDHSAIITEIGGNLLRRNIPRSLSYNTR
ncbi:hypothetical protein KR044_001651, partial [Drosophila immigrans]